ncbi:chemosensory receptor c [Plakobranchus ocellatus]|uniref:Chemosensory receptor c n=1 Tax=Plakobranchus ocellatus TaxID=259542 RepID=A0AAV4CQ19_9GAST|nr:chemosensory receptor c [Plakobranchus ocellatus]
MNVLETAADLPGNSTRILDFSTPDDDGYMDKVMRYLDLYLRIIFLPILCFYAFATNIVNIVVLMKQGVRSCVSLCLLCLSVTDFFSTFAGLCTVPANLMIYLDIEAIVEPYAMYFHLIYLSGLFYDCSNTLTAFLSLERCLCVSLPLKFKDIFTFRRGAGAICGICLLVFGLNVPHFMSSGLEWKISEQNRTYLGLWLSSDRLAVHYYLNITIYFSLTIFNMLMVCVCTQIMLISLRRSSKFQRRKATNPSRDCKADTEEKPREDISLHSSGKYRSDGKAMRKCRTVSSEVKAEQGGSVTEIPNSGSLPPPNEGNIEMTLTSNRQNTPPTSINHSRNVNVMKTVILLCVICFVSNLTRLAATTSPYLEPKLQLGREYDQWYQIFLFIVYIFQMLSCSLNIFVYYRFNQSFRRTFQNVFCCRKET